jgi:peptidyl-prolyl cis-trans isomerase B (cyclophilin B)
VAQNKNQEREAREARERLKRYNARQSVFEAQVKRRKRDNILAIIGVVVVATLATVTQILYFSAGPGATDATPTSSATPTPSAEANVGDVPPVDVAEARTWTGTLTLNDTELAVSLDGAAAPQAVASVIQDVNDGYYIDKTCHRLLVDSLLQCGSLDGTGAGDPTYSFGPIENAPSDGVYPAGTIAMARSDSAYSNGHQFFIVFEETTLPDPAGYSVIGTVTGGLDDLTANITDAGVGEDGTAPATPTTITAFTLE